MTAARGLAALAVSVIPLGSGVAARAAGAAPYGFVTGWQKEQRDRTGRVYRWMGTTSRLVVFGDPRLQSRLSLDVFSLLRQRRVTFTYQGRVLRTRAASALNWSHLIVVVPAGRRPAFLTLSTRPGAESATPVVKGDRRMLSIAVSRLRVVPLP